MKFIGEWYELLSPYLNSREFKTTINSILKLYEDKIIYPDKKNIFKTFREVPPSKIRAIVVAQDPYPGEAGKDIKGNKIEPTPFAIGRAFATHSHLETPKSLKIIIEAVRRYNPDSLIDNSLDNWVNEGIFLYNTALTVEKGKAGSHLKYYNEFTTLFFDVISTHFPNIIFFLWGKQAQSYEIRRGYLIKDVHPAATLYNPKLSFDGGFEKCNKYLNDNNLRPINF